jgi:hypothetical protein
MFDKTYVDSSVILMSRSKNDEWTECQIKENEAENRPVICSRENHHKIQEQIYSYETISMFPLHFKCFFSIRPEVSVNHTAMHN